MQYRERRQESSNIQYREIKQENFNKEKTKMLDDELPKAMRRDYNQVTKEQPVETLKTPEEKTAEVLREFNEYLKKEKKMSNKK